MTLAFLDTETDGLHPTCQAWEVAWILRDTEGADVEHHAFLWVDLSAADPRALAVSGFWDRHPDPYGDRGPMSGVSWPAPLARRLARDLRGVTLVGANPAFDAQVLDRMLRGAGLLPTWHYRLLDVEAMTAGRLGWPMPRSLGDSMAAFSLHIPDTARHTALGDARGVRDLYDALVTP